MSNPDNSSMICLLIPPKVNSQGIWNNAEDPVLKHTLPLLHFQLFVIFCVTEALNFILKHLGLPRLVAQILAGIILGPEVFGSMTDAGRVIFSTGSNDMNQIFGLFSYVLFIFTVGVKIDLGMALNAGKISYFLGILSVLVPFMVGIGTHYYFTDYFSLSDREANSLSYLISLLATTQFTDIIMILEDMKIINSELGRLCLTAGLVSSAFSISITFFSILDKICKEISLAMGIASGILLIALGLGLKSVVRPAMIWVIKQTPEGRPVKGIYIYTILVMALTAGSFTNQLGHFIPLGAFLFGIVVPDGPPLGSAFIDKFDGFLTGVLLPFFVSTTMLTVRFTNVTSKIVTTSILTSVIVWAAKMITCLIPPLFYRMPVNDAFAIAFILSTKGIAEVALYSMIEDSKAIQRLSFMVVPFISLFSCIVTSLLVKYLYDPSRKYANYQRRNIMYTQNSSHLRMLTCVYKSEDTDNIIDLLDACNPTHENPIYVDVLHLIELVGRASPIFISHQLQKKVITKRSYSENVINTFAEYEAINMDMVFVNIFTAISPLKLMHEDICTLALNKQAAFILLPFHRKWAMDGSIELEDDTKRTLNCSVLEKAPCSVGILIDCNNHHSSSKSLRNVCVIFIGGSDDREALTLAKRTIGSTTITLTVLRLVARSDSCKLDWDEMLDSEELRDVKHYSNKKNQEDAQVRYIEEMVNDGGHTSRIIQSVVLGTDLIIVGRRHDLNCPQLMGLMDWSEFPELGVIGDLLVASRDTDMKALVLVVQQQLTS